MLNVDLWYIGNMLNVDLRYIMVYRQHVKCRQRLGLKLAWYVKSFTKRFYLAKFNT
jgi:hypothetical protein